jgi:PKD repeat protein
MKRIITLLAMIAYSFVAKACPFQGTVTHTLTSGASAQLYTAVFPSTNTYTYSWVPAVGATFSSTSISNPTVTFSANGTYYLCCIVTYNGCSTTICDSISINQALGCNASYSYSSSGNTVAFGGIMTGSNSATTYSWIFGDGNTGIGQSTVHTYAPGTYTACLIASNVNPSCTDTFCSTITIAGGATACNAAFTDSNLASTNSVYFINQSTASSSSFFNYWSFGDGNTSTSINPLHTYANPGTYTVCLYMQDSSSAGICYDSTCQTIVVAGSTSSCNATMTYTSSACLGVFVNTSAAGYTNAVWYFGDGTSAINLNQTVTHTYTGTGVYYPFVVVTWMVNGSPCTDTSALGQLYVNCPNASPCNAAFTVSSAGQVVYFTNTSSASNSTFSSYWSFGDGGISGSTNPIHTYANNGIYSVCLYIVDSSSAGICTDSICQTITVGGSSSGTCNAAFIDSVSGLTAMFYNLSTVSGGATYTSAWYFGDGFTSTQTNPIHTYNSPGVYTVCLVIISNNNCIDSFCQIVTVNNPNTVCNASFISTVQMCAVALSNTSTGSYNTGVWVLGNGQYLPLNGNTITANYTSNGTYNVCLVIADSNGMCADTACQAVVIFNCPTSMNNTSLLNQVAISPNPATGFIQLNNTSGQILELTIFNAVGMTVAHQQNIGAKQNIDISNLPSGVYSVMLRSKEGLRYVEKLMKQ